MDDERTMSFMARHRRNQSRKKRRLRATVQACIDRQARKTGTTRTCATTTLTRCATPPK